MKKFFNSIYPVDEEILDEYLSYYDNVGYKRKDFITKAGDVERFLYFVEEGIQRSFCIKEDKEHVMAFTYPPSVTGVPESFFTQQPSRYYLECLTDSKLIRISYSDHQKMLRKHRPLETLFRKSTEILLAGILDRHYELLALTIEERFRAFTKRSPHLLNMVPHKHIASYLRIDPSNFSKLLGSINI